MALIGFGAWRLRSGVMTQFGAGIAKVNATKSGAKDAMQDCKPGEKQARPAG